MIVSSATIQRTTVHDVATKLGRNVMRFAEKKLGGCKILEVRVMDTFFFHFYIIQARHINLPHNISDSKL